jgi:hypothetical protein
MPPSCTEHVFNAATLHFLFVFSYRLQVMSTVERHHTLFTFTHHFSPIWQLPSRETKPFVFPYAREKFPHRPTFPCTQLFRSVFLSTRQRQVACVRKLAPGQITESFENKKKTIARKFIFNGSIVFLQLLVRKRRKKFHQNRREKSPKNCKNFSAIIINADCCRWCWDKKV